jgi:streptogramin lyase
VTPSHDILLATDEGVRKVDPDALRHNEIRLLPPPFPYILTRSMRCNYLYFGRDSSLWLVSGKEITRIDREGGKQTFTGENGLPPGQISSILQDLENNIWFTNEQNGLVKLVSRQVEFYTQPEPGFTMTDISARDNSDSVWFYDRLKKSLLLTRGNIRKIYRGIGFLPPPIMSLSGRRAMSLPERRSMRCISFPDSGTGPRCSSGILA